MTDNEINRAVAVACGWKLSKPHFGHDLKWRRTAYFGDRDIWDCDISELSGDVIDDWSDVPYYCRDLNACADAVISQPYSFRVMFQRSIDSRAIEIGWLVCELKARDWAECFLRVKGKWVDA